MMQRCDKEEERRKESGVKEIYILSVTGSRKGRRGRGLDLFVKIQLLCSYHLPAIPPTTATSDWGKKGKPAMAARRQLWHLELRVRHVIFKGVSKTRLQDEVWKPVNVVHALPRQRRRTVREQCRSWCVPFCTFHLLRPLRLTARCTHARTHHPAAPPT